MRNAGLAVVAAWLLVSAAGCHKTKKAEQLAALESAYQSGVLTKEEYDAKHQALAGPPAAPAAAPAPASAPEIQTPAAQPANEAVPVPAGALPSPVAPAPAVSPAPRAVAPAKRKATPATAPVPAGALPPPAEPAPVAPSAPPAAAEAAVPAPAPAPPAPAPPADSPKATEAAEPEPAPLPGCEDAEYKSGKEKGVQERFFPAPVEAVRKAASAALKNLDFTIHKDAGNEMEASKRRHIGVLIGAGGERVLLHFAKAQRGGRQGTQVTGETQKRLIGRLAQKSWTNAVLAQIACNLHESPAH